MNQNVLLPFAILGYAVVNFTIGWWFGYKFSNQERSAQQRLISAQRRLIETLQQGIARRDEALGIKQQPGVEPPTVN